MEDNAKRNHLVDAEKNKLMHRFIFFHYYFITMYPDLCSPRRHGEATPADTGYMSPAKYDAVLFQVRNNAS